MTHFTVKKLNTIIIPVKKMERSIDFYQNVLGLSLDYIEGSMAWFTIGDETSVMLHTIDKPEPVETGIVIELMVDDLIACVTAVKHADGTIIQEPVKREWGVIEAVIADPDGYRIWVVQPT